GVAHKIRRTGVVNDEVTRRRQRQINWTTDSRLINMTLSQVALESILVNRDSTPDQAIKWSRQFSKCRAQLAIHFYGAQQTPALNKPFIVRKWTTSNGTHASLRIKRRNKREEEQNEGKSNSSL